MTAIVDELAKRKIFIFRRLEERDLSAICEGSDTDPKILKAKLQDMNLLSQEGRLCGYIRDKDLEELDPKLNHEAIKALFLHEEGKTRPHSIKFPMQVKPSAYSKLNPDQRELLDRPSYFM